MSDNKKLKKAARERQKRTGESYSTARMLVLRSLEQATAAPISPSSPAPPPPGPSTTVEKIRAVLEAHPDLTYFGFRAALRRYGTARRDVLEHEFEAERAHLLDEDGVQQVEKCLYYLALVPKRRSARRREDRTTLGSYTMKHEVEAWLRKAGKVERDAYIANGAFIVAALIAEVPLLREDRDSPNCLVGLEYEDVRAVQEGKDPHKWRKTTRFVKWLFAQAGREDPVGDLAADCERDFKFPRQGNVAAIRSYLARYGGHIHEAFEEARLEYRGLP